MSQWLLTVLTVALCLIALGNLQQRGSFRLPADGATWVDSEAGATAARVEPEGPADLVGVRPGDSLRAINGRGLDRALDVARALAATGAWSRALYTLERGGTTFDVDLVVGEAARRPAVEWFLWIAGACHLLIGALVFFRNGEQSSVRIFYAYCLASFALYALSYTGRLDAFDRLVYWIDVWANVVAPALFLHFCLAFPYGRLSRRATLGAAAAWSGAAGLVILQHIAASGMMIWERPLGEVRWLLDQGPQAFLGACFLLGAGIVARAPRQESDAVVRGQRRWIAAGAGLGAAPFTLFYIAPYVMGQIPSAEQTLSVFSLGLIPLGFAGAILKHRLMDVDLVMRRGAAVALATGVLLTLFYVSVAAAAAAFGSAWELGPATWALTVALAALAFHPLRRRIEKALDKRFYGERYDYRRTVLEFSAELSADTDQDRLLAAMTERLRRTLGVAKAAIFTREDEGRFRLVHGSGLESRSGEPFEPCGALEPGFLESPSGGGRGWLYFEDPSSALAAEPSARDQVADLDLNYYVPCLVRGRTAAWIGLGRTREGDLLSSDDLGLVQAISGPFATALENARLYRSLDEKAAQYQRLKEYNENIVESLHAGILATDLDGRVESWNTPLELLLGISRRQAVGRGVRDLLPTALAAEIEKSRDEHGVHNIYKFRLRAGDLPEEFAPAADQADRERMLDIAVAPLVDKDLAPIGRLIILDDISERAELEAQVAQADKLSSIGLLAAGVAHEVNTPLAVISSYAQMLARQAEGDAALSRIVEKITSQTFRASEIVNSLLSFSRTSSSQFERVDLNSIIKDTLALVEPQMREAAVAVETDLDARIAPLRAVTNKLQQVFLNLILNARDAMPKGGRLRITTERVELAEGEPAARIIVSDTGVGMRADQAARVFEPFFTTKGAAAGTGLGLAVSYGIIQEHGGKIRVDSAPGSGATFTLELPLAGKPIHA